MDTDTNYDAVADNLICRVSSWIEDAKVIRNQLSRNFFGAEGDAEVILSALRRVLTNAENELAIVGVPF
jgi:hypothetical protein